MIILMIFKILVQCPHSESSSVASLRPFPIPALGLHHANVLCLISVHSKFWPLSSSYWDYDHHVAMHFKITAIIIIMITLFVGASQCLASPTHHILIRIRIMMIALIMSTGQNKPTGQTNPAQIHRNDRDHHHDQCLCQSNPSSSSSSSWPMSMSV